MVTYSQYENQNYFHLLLLYRLFLIFFFGYFSLTKDRAGERFDGGWSD
jgi:hypothetical protein